MAIQEDSVVLSLATVLPNLIASSMGSNVMLSIARCFQLPFLFRMKISHAYSSPYQWYLSSCQAKNLHAENSHQR